MRPELTIVQPPAPRVTEICSVPTGTALTNTVKLSAEGSWVGASGGSCARATPAAPTAPAMTPARIKWIESESMLQHSIMVSRVSEEMYRKAREGAAFLDRDRGRLVVSGPDRASFLQGLLTNDIAALAAGRGCYAAYLTPQGRMIADLFVYELADLMLLTVPIGIKDSLIAKLDRLIFTEDVKLGDVTATFAQTAVVGPEAASISSLVLDGVSAETLDSRDKRQSSRA